MASKIEIANMALGLVGADPILAVDNSTQAGRVVNLFYDTCKKAVLREHAWNFATRRVALVEFGSTPAFQWDKYFVLPVDCIRVLQLNETNDSFHIEGSLLACDQVSASIEYTYNVLEGDFDPMFTEAFAYALAAHMAIALSKSPQLSREIREIYETVILPAARTVSSQESSGDVWLADDFLLARTSGV